MTTSARDPRPPPEDSSARYDVVAIASSAGGIRALTKVLSHLPAALPVVVLVVQHLDPDHPSHLAEILSRCAPMPVKEAEDEERVVPGRIYLAPPNHHLLANPDGTLSLTKTKFVHFVRPSADLLFDSVAASHGNRAIAVVLTGAGRDGATGVQAIVARGGVVLAQDEATSEFFGMPGAAIRTGDVARVLPLEEIAPAVVALVRGPVAA